MLEYIVETGKTSSLHSVEIPQCVRALDVVFLVDVSSAVNDTEWKWVADAVQTVSAALRPSMDGTNISVITFDDVVRTTVRQSQLKGGALQRPPHPGVSRNLSVALGNISGGGVFYRVDVPDVLVVFLAASSSDRDAAVREAGRLKFDGVKIVAVGLTPEVDVDELKAIATNPNEAESLLLGDYRELTSASTKILSYVCHFKAEGKRKALILNLLLI